MPDVIVIDIMPTGSSCLAALREIQRLDDGVQVVMHSTFDDAVFHQEATCIGAAAFVSKGDAAQLVPTVERLMRKAAAGRIAESVQHLEILDLSRLEAIAVGSGMTQAAILREFRFSNATDEASMRAAAKKRDFQATASLAHRLGGSAAVLGAARLAQACAAVVHAIDAEDALWLQDAFADFHRQTATLNNYIDSLGAVDAIPDSSSATAAGGQPPCAGLSFMVVEDHDFQRSVLVRTLERMGAREVLGFNGAEAALRALDESVSGYDIMVLDLSLPGMSAIELLRTIGERSFRVCVILNSALCAAQLAEPLDAARGFGVQMLGALSKPLTVANLMPLIALYRANHAGRRADCNEEPHDD